MRAAIRHEHTSPALRTAPMAVPIVRRFGRAEYEPVWRAMQEFTGQRTEATPNELWLLEHPPIYTYGVAGRGAHLPRTHTNVPVLKVDRGGQVTYHGPGQLIVYVLWDIARDKISVRQLVRTLEAAVISLLAELGIEAHTREAAPGVYVAGAKVASLGLKIRKGRSYHGLALNVDMDLAPFSIIDPCGFPSLPVTCLRDLGVREDMNRIGERLLEKVWQQLGVSP